MHIVGARPNFMKAAPVLRAMREKGGFSQTLLHTGQHYDRNMSQVFFEELGLPQPDINLEVGSDSHAVQTAKIMQRFEPVAKELSPDWVLVYGDVNSTLACALVCSKLLIRVGHVEAGLRSYDRSMPEEINRLLVDQISDVLFTPSRDAGENLLGEGVSGARIQFVGNVMIDTLKHLKQRAEQRWEGLCRRLGLGRYILVTLHRPTNVDHPDRLKALLRALNEVAADIEVLLPIHPRTQSRIDEYGLSPLLSAVRLLEPVGYLDFLALQSHASLVVTDSGGMQEETTFLGVPCLTVRPGTERPVTLEQGTNRLFNAHPHLLSGEIKHRLSEPRIERRPPELWDGRSAIRIAEILAEA